MMFFVLGFLLVRLTYKLEHLPENVIKGFKNVILAALQLSTTGDNVQDDRKT
jgi:hypothetical protein